MSSSLLSNENKNIEMLEVTYKRQPNQGQQLVIIFLLVVFYQPKNKINININWNRFQLTPSITLMIGSFNDRNNQ